MIAILSNPRAGWMVSLLRRIAAVLVLAVAAAGCDQQSGITAPSARRANLETALEVEIDGPSHVDYAGDYTYTAYASYGVGGYTYSWTVYRPQTGYTQMATTTNQATIHIGEGEGEAMMYVTVTSGSEVVSTSKFTTNGIGCDGDYC